LIEARKSLGLGQRRLAVRCQEVGTRQQRQPPDVDSIERAIRRIERGEVQRPRGDFYVPTLCEVLARVSKDLVVRLRFLQVQRFSIFSFAYYPCQRRGAYRSRSKIV
jgi:hypothetical protein